MTDAARWRSDRNLGNHESPAGPDGALLELVDVEWQHDIELATQGDELFGDHDVSTGGQRSIGDADVVPFERLSDRADQRGLRARGLTWNWMSGDAVSAVVRDARNV